MLVSFSSKTREEQDEDEDEDNDSSAWLCRVGNALTLVTMGYWAFSSGLFGVTSSSLKWVEYRCIRACVFGLARSLGVFNDKAGRLGPLVAPRPVSLAFERACWASRGV